MIIARIGKDYSDYCLRLIMRLEIRRDYYDCKRFEQRYPLQGGYVFGN